MRQIEIFRRNGRRYEMCDILYWPEDRKEPDYIIVMDGKGQEVICRRAMGAWTEMTTMDIVMRLRLADHVEAAL